MQWSTPVNIKKSDFEISHNTKFVSIGSCFADNIGNYFLKHKIDCESNPFGTVFNIYSIFKILENYNITEKEFYLKTIEVDGLFYHYDYHSNIREKTKQLLFRKIQKTNESLFSYLKNAEVLILTIGTSLVYYHNDLQCIVSNCHKQNSNLFAKKSLTPNKQLDIYENIYTMIKLYNPNLKIILTLSPVRHIKDGLIENQLSKSTARVAIGEILEKYKNASYFPAYEIMIDELRDYRFYDIDMIHPSTQAVDYIISKFVENYFNIDAQNFIKKWDEIISNINHKPFNIESDNHQKFLKNTLEKLEKLNKEVSCNDEIKVIKDQII